MYMFEFLCSEDKHGADSDPINHEQALTGDEYALVDISSKKKAVPVENKGLYQVHVHTCSERQLHHLNSVPS